MAFISFDNDYEVHDSAGGEVESNMAIVLCVVVDMTKDFNQGTDARSHLELVELVAARHDDMTLRKGSIIGALRANQDPGDRVWIDAGEETTVEFDATPRDKGLFTAEAIVRFKVKQTYYRDCGIIRVTNCGLRRSQFSFCLFIGGAFLLPR